MQYELNGKIGSWYIDNVSLIPGDESFKNKQIVNVFRQLV